MEAYQEFFRIGQYTDAEAMTGCTVILCQDGVTGGVSVRGGSPNTRDTDALKSENNRKFVHGVTLFWWKCLWSFSECWCSGFFRRT